MNDAELVGDVLAGRTERFDALVSRYVGLARGLCASLVRDAAARDDVVQDSFVYAYTHLESLRDRRRFGPWLCSIVRNKSRDWLRSNKRREATERNLASEQSASPATPEDALIGEELRDWVRTQLSSLPERTREAMFLCYVEGMDQKEAAAFLGISIAALKKRLQYGRDRISERIWRDLENADRPKRDHAKLAGAIMVAVQTAHRPAVAGTAATGVTAATLSIPRTPLVAALVVLVGAGAAIYSITARQPVSSETTVAAAPADNPPEASIAEPSPPESTQAELPAEKSVSRQEPEPVASGITGVVVMKDTRAPIEGVEVELLTYAGNRTGLVATKSHTTDADGAFVFPLVDPESEFSLSLGWPHRYAADPFKRTRNSEPQPTHYVLEARTVGAITGHVRHPDGSPVAHATIKREYGFGNQWDAVDKSDTYGRYGFAHDGGIWRLAATNNLGNESTKVSLDIALLDVVEHDFVLPEGASIHLTLTAPDAAHDIEISRVNVSGKIQRLSSNEGPFATSIGTDESILIREGSVYSLPLLLKGQYNIEIGAKGFHKAVAGPFIIDQRLEDQYAVLKLEPRVQTPRDSMREDPVAKAKERRELEPILLGLSAQDAYGNTLETSGLFIYAIGDSGEVIRSPEGLLPGAYWTAAIKEGYGADIRLQVVSEDSDKLAFTFGPGGSIHGSVPDGFVKKIYVLPMKVWEAIGKPSHAREAESDYRQLGNALSQGATPNDDLTFALPELPGGWYVVLTDRHASEPVEVRVDHATGPVLLSTGPAAAEE